jgi:hypothetical protein
MQGTDLQLDQDNIKSIISTASHFVYLLVEALKSQQKHRESCLSNDYPSATMAGDILFTERQLGFMAHDRISR